MLRLLAVGDFVGVVLEILYGPRSGPAFAAVTNSSRAGVLGRGPRLGDGVRRVRPRDPRPLPRPLPLPPDLHIIIEFP